MAKRFIAIGECMVEMSGGQNGLFTQGFAGDCFNTAWYARALLEGTWEVEFLTALGGDIYSRQMREFIEANNISTRYISSRSHRNVGLYLIHQADGDRHFTYWRENSAARTLADDADILLSALAESDLIYFSGITLAIIGKNGRENLFWALQQARSNGAKIAFDPNIRPPLWIDCPDYRDVIEGAAKFSDIVLPSFDDEQAHFGDKNPQATLARYQSLGVAEIIVKNGAESAFLFANGESHEVSTKPVTAIDATGAGDSFNGAYLASRFQEQTPLQSVQNAHVTASQVVAHAGALLPINQLKMEQIN